FGLPEHAPFDKILVSAGAEDIPPELVRELAPGGRIAIPVGDDYAQQLMIGTKHADGTLELHRTIQCIFVPLVSSAPS
ncbi:MAG TPA: protein-L-isoaspartate O-methyltransferase, partial [Polyangiaceae bacterium]|nr:protein-L-isoaspartate O-methyltransferase [Polyangiaceae bacterium]